MSRKVESTDIKPDPTTADADDAFGFTTTRTDFY